MPTPTMPELADAAAKALGGTTDPNTGVKHQTFNVDDDSVPSAFARLMNLENNLMILAAAAAQGQVIDLESGLTIGAYPIRYRIGATAYVFAGSASYTLTASSTNYVYLDTDAALEHSTSGWPAGDHVKLATVVTDATQVTSVTDRRFENHPVGVISNWWTILPSADPNLNNKELVDLGWIDWTDWETKTIASDAITPTRMLTAVDTEAGAAADNLATITATAGKRRMVMLRNVNAARVVTVKDLTGNITMAYPNGDCVLGDPTHVLALIQDTDTTWRELFRSRQTISQLSSNLDAFNYNISNISKLHLQPNDHTIASDAITPTRSVVTPRAESGTTDDLSTISGGSYGDMVRLRYSTSAPGHVITVKHNVGNLQLANGKDYVIDGHGKELMLVRNNFGTWYEVRRATPVVGDLSDTGRGIPHTVPLFVAGALTVAVLKPRLKMQTDYVIKKASGELGTAPAGGACIIDVRVNGNSIFANQSEMINIAAAATADDSAVKNYLGAAGDVIDLECEAANSAADLTVSLDLYLPLKTPPA
jgi:hypothetical protein